MREDCTKSGCTCTCKSAETGQGCQTGRHCGECSEGCHVVNHL